MWCVRTLNSIQWIRTLPKGIMYCTIYISNNEEIPRRRSRNERSRNSKTTKTKITFLSYKIKINNQFGKLLDMLMKCRLSYKFPKQRSKTEIYLKCAIKGKAQSCLNGSSSEYNRWIIICQSRIFFHTRIRYFVVAYLISYFTPKNHYFMVVNLVRFSTCITLPHNCIFYKLIHQV